MKSEGVPSRVEKHTMTAWWVGRLLFSGNRPASFVVERAG